MTREEALSYYKEKALKVEQELKRIFDKIEDANVQGGIEESCRVQNEFAYRIDYLLDRFKYYDNSIKILKAQVD